MTDVSAPEWRTHWREASHYSTRHSIAEWRWQFLRRRADYQQAWIDGENAYSDACCRRPDLVTEARNSDVRVRWNAMNALAAEAGEPQLAERFGLETMLDPAIDYGEGDICFLRPDWGGVLNLGEGEVRDAHLEGKVIVAFDLDWDIEEQLVKTRAMLTDERENLKRNTRFKRAHPQRWSQYLRVLDARVCGASLAEIGLIVLECSDLNYDERAARAHQKHDDALALQVKLTE